MFQNTTIVPETPSNVPGTDSSHASDVSNDSPFPPRAPNKVCSFDTAVQVATPVQMATYNISGLGGAPNTPVNLQGALTTPVFTKAPKKAAPPQSRIPVKSKATAGQVAKNVLRAPTPVTPTKASVRMVPPVVPITAARGLPYRAPSTWTPRRGNPVSVIAIEAKAFIPNAASLVRTLAPTSPTKTIVCGPQPGKFKMVPLGRKLPTASTATSVKHQNMVKFSTPELDLSQDIFRRVLHRVSDKVIAYHDTPTTPVSKQPPRPKVPSTSKSERIVNELTKVKVSQPGDASVMLMLLGAVDQTPKTPGRKGQVKMPVAPTKTGKVSSKRAPTKDVARLRYTVVSTTIKSVSHGCAMRSTADSTQMIVAVTPPEAEINTPLAPIKTSKTSKFRPIEEIVRLEYCVVYVPPKSVSDESRAMPLTSIENVVASEYVVVDLAEVMTPQAEHFVDVPRAPRKTMRTRSLRYLKKVSKLDFSRALEDE